MRLHRLTHRPFAALDGEGARRFGGRWNSPGRAVVYAASHLSLAALEWLAHAQPRTLPADLVSLEIDVPAHVARERVDVARLPDEWRDATDPRACRAIGDAWLAGPHSALLAVPSVIVAGETNWLLDPRHPDAAHVRVVRVRPFAFDARVVGLVG